MTEDAGKAFSGIPTPLLLSCGWLTGVGGLLLPVVAVYGYRQHGTAGVAAAILAVSVCWIGGMTALAVTGWTSDPHSAISRLFLSILCRTGIPLFGGIMLSLSGGPLADAGVFGMIVACYLVMLVAETIISVRMLQPARNRQGL